MTVATASARLRTNVRTGTPAGDSGRIGNKGVKIELHFHERERRGVAQANDQIVQPVTRRNEFSPFWKALIISKQNVNQSADGTLRIALPAGPLFAGKKIASANGTAGGKRLLA
jgi:hypothetical protein